MVTAGRAVSTEACIDVNDRACVNVSPVQCIYEFDDAWGTLRFEVEAGSGEVERAAVRSKQSTGQSRSCGDVWQQHPLCENRRVHLVHCTTHARNIGAAAVTRSTAPGARGTPARISSQTSSNSVSRRWSTATTTSKSESHRISLRDPEDVPGCFGSAWPREPARVVGSYARVSMARSWSIVGVPAGPSGVG